MRASSIISTGRPRQVLLLLLVVATLCAPPTLASRLIKPIATTDQVVATTSTSESTTISGNTVASRARAKRNKKGRAPAKIGRRKKSRIKKTATGLHVEPALGGTSSTTTLAAEEVEPVVVDGEEEEEPEIKTPARIIDNDEEEDALTEAIEDEEAAILADQEELLMELGVKEGEAADEDLVVQEEVASILSSSTGGKKMQGKMIATTELSEEATPEEEEEDKSSDSDDRRRRRDGGRIYTTQRASSTASSNSIWTKPTRTTGGGTRRNLELLRGASESTSRPKRRQLKGGGTSKLKLSKTSSKGKKTAKAAKGAKKSSPIDCKERPGKKCKQKGVKKTAGESRGARITKEEGVLEREIEPDYSLADVTNDEAYDMMYQESKAFPMIDLRGGSNNDKRFYNGEDADVTAGTAPLSNTDTGGDPALAIPEFEPRPIPVRMGSSEHEETTRAGSTSNFRGRTSFYSQTKQDQASDSAATPATTIASGADGDEDKIAYDQYEAWFNEMDLVEESDGEEPVDPDEFFEAEEEEDEVDGQTEGIEDTTDDASVADFFAVDEVADEAVSYNDNAIESFFGMDNDDEGEGDDDGEVDADAFFAVDNDDEGDTETGEDVDTAAFFAVDNDDDGTDESGEEIDIDAFFAVDNDDEDGEGALADDDDEDEGGSYLAAFNEANPTTGQQQTSTLANSIPEGESAGEAIREEYSIQSETTNGVTYWEQSVSAKPVYVQAIGNADLSTRKQEFFDSLEPLLTRHLESVLGNDLLEDYQLTITYVIPEDQVIQLRRGSDAKTYTTQMVVLVLLHLRSEKKDDVASVTAGVATEAVQAFFDPTNIDLRTLLRVLNAKGVPTREIQAQGEPHPPRNHAMDHGISGITTTDTAVHERGHGTSRNKAQLAALAALTSCLVMIIALVGLFCYNRQRREKFVNSGRAVLGAASDFGTNAVESVRSHGSNAVESVRSQVNQKRGGQSRSYFNFNRRSTGASLHSTGSSTISYIQPAAIQLRRNRPKSVEVPNTPLAGRQDDRFDMDSKPSSIYDIDINDEADLTGVRSNDDSENLIELDNEMEDSDDMSMIEEGDYESDDDSGAYKRQNDYDRVSRARNKVAMNDRFADEDDEDEDEEIGNRGYSSALTRSSRPKGYRLTASGNAMTQKSFVPLSPLSAALAEALADESPRRITHTSSRAPTPPFSNHRGLDPEPSVTFADNYHYGTAMSPPISMEDIMPDEYINQDRWRDQVDDESTEDQNTVESSVMTGMTPETRIILHDNELSKRRNQYRY